MKYRIIKDNSFPFPVYIPQYYKNGKRWESWYKLAYDIEVPIHFYLLKKAKQFIEWQRKADCGPEVVWESEE